MDSFDAAFCYGTLAFIFVLIVLGVPRAIIPWFLGLELLVLAVVGAI